MPRQTQAVDVNDQGEPAAEECQNQRVGHGPHHIPPDVPAGAPQLPPGHFRVDGLQLAEGGGNGHGHIHHGAQG